MEIVLNYIFISFFATVVMGGFFACEWNASEYLLIYFSLYSVKLPYNFCSEFGIINAS